MHLGPSILATGVLLRWSGRKKLRRNGKHIVWQNPKRNEDKQKCFSSSQSS